MTADPAAYAPLPADADLFDAVERAEGALVHLEDVLLAKLTRVALDEDGEDIPAEELYAELGL